MERIHIKYPNSSELVTKTTLYPVKPIDYIEKFGLKFFIHKGVVYDETAGFIESKYFIVSEKTSGAAIYSDEARPKVKQGAYLLAEKILSERGCHLTRSAVIRWREKNILVYRLQMLKRIGIIKGYKF